MRHLSPVIRLADVIFTPTRDQVVLATQCLYPPILAYLICVILVFSVNDPCP